MKTAEEFERFFYNHLLTDLAELEKERNRLRFWIIVILLLGVLLAVVLLGLFGRSGQMMASLFFLVLFMIGIGFFYIWNLLSKGISKNFVYRFKRVVIDGIVRFIEPSLTYNPKSYITWLDFQRSDLFRDRVDRYAGEDLVYGRFGETEIRFSEIKAEKKVSSSNKKGEERWQTIFKGTFLIADFHKEFFGRTVIFPDFAENVFGALGQLFQGMRLNRGELIKLENPEFEKYFVVYGSDQIESRYILSPSFMERLLTYRGKVGSPVFFSFANSCIFVAIPTKRNLFEPDLLKNLTDFTHIKTYFDDLSLLIGVVEDLNLNTRIWSKQS
ncbi:MAG: DUF3137 domain-containing protein [Thermotogae bacterium]|nr:DUF3137 domain-containing protein [Thermotogota bacterium]